MTDSLPTAVFFANAGSRQTETLYDDAVRALEAEGVFLEKAESFEEVPALLDAVQDAIQNQARLIIVGGGDGTLSAATNLISKSEATLGVMPLGTANQFARELGIEPTVAEAAKVIANGRTCKVDVASIGEERFINVATIGITTKIARSLRFKKELGTLAYLPAVIQAFQTMEPFTVEVTSGDFYEKREVVLLVVSNGRYHAGPFVSSPNASLTTGLLEAYMVEPGNLWQMVKIGALALSGDHIDLEPVHLVQATTIEVKTTPKMPLTIDGETTWLDEMVFKSVPGGLRVCVPESFRAPQERLERLYKNPQDPKPLQE